MDVSVLFAMIYGQHERHADVRKWFAKSGSGGWATCAYTQMSAMRLLCSHFAPNLNLSSPAAASFVRTLCAHPKHVYWPQDIVPSGEAAFNWDLVRGRNQFPDIYLLALAVRNAGVLVTLDTRINIAGVSAAKAEHLLIL